jgi:hypothetical protein
MRWPLIAVGVVILFVVTGALGLQTDLRGREGP